MPQSTMREEDEYALPEDTLFPGVLNKVDVRTIKWKSKRDGSDQSRDVWTWEFQITDGEYAPLRAWGESEDRLTTHPDNKVRQWGETLRGKPFELGEGLNTDDLIGLPCMFTIKHEEPRPRKDGTGNFYGVRVDDVFPVDALQPADPPF
jgi:hypothetical protein